MSDVFLSEFSSNSLKLSSVNPETYVCEICGKIPQIRVDSPEPFQVRITCNFCKTYWVKDLKELKDTKELKEAEKPEEFEKPEDSKNSEGSKRLKEAKKMSNKTGKLQGFCQFITKSHKESSRPKSEYYCKICKLNICFYFSCTLNFFYCVFCRLSWLIWCFWVFSPSSI